jgi:hypothetical protein
MAREILNKDGSPMREYDSEIIRELLNEQPMTAVDLIIKHIDEVIYMWNEPDMEMDFEHTLLTLKEFCKDKKEMEKEQMINFTDDYVDNCVIPNENMAIPTKMDVPEYYNEAYGGDKSN